MIFVLKNNTINTTLEILSLSASALNDLSYPFEIVDCTL